MKKKAAIELLNSKKIQSCKQLFSILKEEKANLIVNMKLLVFFVKECEENNLTSTPLYKWTKDTIENETKKIKYMKSFTIYVEDKQLYEKNIANRLERKILEFKLQLYLKT